MLFLCQLEGVRQAYAAVRQIGFPTGYLMEYRFYVHIRDIIGQQHDFIAMNFVQILAFHILRADKSRLQQSRNERTCAHKRVKDMYILCGQRSVELRLENIIHRADDEIYTLNGRINNTQFFHCKRECTLKEFLI